MVVEFLRLSLFGVGIICVDFADFQTVIYACRSHRLRLELIHYDSVDQVPYHKHVGPACRTLYGFLIGGNELGLSHTLDFSDVVEQHNPDLVCSKLGMKLYSCDAPMMMLLGESV